MCICTAGRNEQFAHLLDRIADQSSIDAGRTHRVVVIDNNARPEVEGELARWEERTHIQTVYRHVGTRNLAVVRNEALRQAAHLAPFAALVDDDELPEKDWLQNLFRTQETTGAPVVIGPVRAVYPAGTPEWFVACGAFELREYPEGARLSEGITGNALLDMRVICDRGLCFDERLGRSGGEDQVFFRQAHATGVDIRYAAEAVVYEPVVPERLRLRWVLARELRKGTTLGWIARNHPDLGESVWYRAAAAGKWLAIALAGLVCSPLTRYSRTEAVRSLLRGARAVGMLSGLLGWTPTTYE